MEPSATNLSAIKMRIVHLADHTGRLQAIFPDKNMLDIAAISRITKRRFQPIANFNVAGDSLLKPNSSSTILEKSLITEPLLSFRTSADSPYKNIEGSQLEKLFLGPLNRFEAISIPVSSINKPVEHHEDDEAQILKALGQFQSIRIKQRLEETLEVPPLPASSHRIIRLCSDEKAGTDELCEIIRLDPSLSAQIMSWASSPYYGAPGNINSVEDAIIRVLGFDLVMNLAIGLSMGNAFEAPENGPRHYEDFWLSSIRHAVLIESLVKRMTAEVRPKIGIAYLAGLLHNFGYLAISTIMPPHFSILSRYQEANAHLPPDVVEMEVMNFTKEQLGSWLLRYWSLPDSIWTAIRYSRNPHYYGEHSVLAKLIYVVHQLCSDEPIEPRALQEIGLSLEDVTTCYEKVYSSSAELHKMVSLINGSKT